MSKELHQYCKTIVETSSNSKLLIGLKGLEERLNNPGARNTSVPEGMTMLDLINNSISSLSFVGTQLTPGNAFRNFVASFGKGINGGHLPDHAFAGGGGSFHSNVTFGADVGLALLAVYKTHLQIVKKKNHYDKNREDLAKDLRIAYVTLLNAFLPLLQGCASSVSEAKKYNEAGLSVQLATLVWNQLVDYRFQWYCQL